MTTLRRWARLTAAAGTLASAGSALALAWRGRRDNRSASAPLNAPSHWVWGCESLRRNRPSWRYTAVGFGVHHAMSLFWAALFALRRPRGRALAVHAAAVASLAAAVDLKLVPKRWSPGFERRLTAPSLVWVYAAFATGLALGARLAERADRR